MFKSTTLRKAIQIILVVAILSPTLSSCSSKHMSVEQRKKKQAKNKKKSPNGCPQLDCD
jgi:hypothetical protein